MASAVAVRVANNILRDRPRAEGISPQISSETFTKEVIEDADIQDVESSSSYTLARQSQFSSDVDRWIRGNTSIQSTGVQNSRAHLVQRSTLAMAPSFASSAIWYMLAMVFPLFSISPDHWRCDPSVVLNTAELVLAHIAYICQRIRNHIRRLAREQVARDLFATAMDIVLVVYAMGFLILSMYQASIIG